MCGRFQQSSDIGKLQNRFGFAVAPADFRARWNLAPGQPALVVRQREGRREGAMLRWGLVPSWAKDSQSGYKMINARAEGIASKPAFRGPFKRSRCLVPADAFYEWAKAPGGKEPWRLALASGQPFALAGLWDAWPDPKGGRLESFTIITTRANPLVAKLHERMPVMLPIRGEGAWLDPASPAGELTGLLKPFPAGGMTAERVSRRLNSPAHEGPELLEPDQASDGLFPGEGGGA